VQIIGLDEVISKRNGTVDPTKFPSEYFELLSIPAFDVGKPEIAIGAEIGSTKQVVQEGDVLLSKIVPHIRRAWVVKPTTNHRLIASGEWIVFRDSRFDPNYLRHLLTADGFHRQFMQTVSGIGGSLLRARPAEVAKIKVPLPPKIEQRRIATILDKADCLRRKRQAAVRLADQFLRATFIELFGNPVTNSQGWPMQELKSLGTLDRGVSKHRPRNDPRLLGGDYPLIQTGDVANCDGYIRAFTSTYSEVGLKQSKLWPAGTLCITIAANIAKTGILLFPACFPDSVVGFRATERPTIEYVRFWLSFLQQTLEDNAPASAQKNINLAILRELQIPVPPRDRLERFAAAVDKVEAIRKAQRLAVDEGLKLTRALECALIAP
jgi:type I restriction enzyme S subunit